MCRRCVNLTPAQRRERHGDASMDKRNAQIRELAATGTVPYQKIADLYGISRQRVSAIVKVGP